MNTTKKTRGKRPAVQLFLKIREKGKILIGKLHANQSAEKPRSDSEILREVGLSSFDLWKMRPYLTKFEAEISKDEFDLVEQEMFSPTATDYKALAFYQTHILGKAKQKPKARKVSSRVGEKAPPRLPAPPAAAQPAKYPTAGPQSQIPQAAPVAESDAADTPVAPKSGSPAVAFKSPALTAPAALPTPPTVSAASPTKLSAMANPFQKTQTPIQRFEAAPPTSP
jgi:hypothetical protein